MAKRVLTPRSVTISVIAAAGFAFTLTQLPPRREDSFRFGTTFKNQPPAKPYPQKISLQHLPNGVNSEFGFQILNQSSGLHGSFMIAQPADLNRGSKPSSGVSILQRLNVDGKGRRVQNFQFPNYADSDIYAITSALFSSDLNHGFVSVRVSTGSDVGQYNLYEFDLTTQRAVSKIERLFSGHRFVLSPDGRDFVYETSEPWSGAFYRIIAAIRGRERRVLESEVSGDFTWSPRASLIYSAYPPQHDSLKYFDYPNIYEDDLKGHKKLLKVGSARPLMSPDGRYLACYQADVTSQMKPNEWEDLRFDGRNRKQEALIVYDLKTRENLIVKHFKPASQDDSYYAQLFWSRDGHRLFVVENSYDGRHKTAVCKVLVFDVATKKSRLLCRLLQKGDASSVYDDEKFVPHFTPLKIANGKQLLFLVPVRKTGGHNQHVVSVDLEHGRRRDILAFTSADSYEGVPLVDWIDDPN